MCLDGLFGCELRCCNGHTSFLYRRLLPDTSTSRPYGLVRGPKNGIYWHGVQELWYLHASYIDLTSHPRYLDPLLLVGLDKKNQELVYMQYDDELDDELEIRPSLMERYGTINIYSTFKDAHVYLFKKCVLDIVLAKKDLGSIREDLVPYLVRCSASPSFARREGVDKSTSLFFKFQYLHDIVLSNAMNKNVMYWELDDPTYFLSVPETTPPTVSTLSRNLDKVKLSKLPPSTTSLESSGGSNAKPVPLDHGGMSQVSLGTVASTTSSVPASEEDDPLQIIYPTRVLTFAMTLTPTGQTLSAHPAPYDKPPKPLPKTNTSKNTAHSLNQGHQLPKPVLSRTSFPCPGVEPTYCLRANTLPAWVEINRHLVRFQSPSDRLPMTIEYPPNTQSVQIGADSMVGEGTKLGEKCLVKKSVVGAHCVLGKGVKIVNSILLDYCIIEDKYLMTA